MRVLFSRALSHRDFFRIRTLLKAGFFFLPEYFLFKKVFSAPKLINFLFTRHCNLNCSICHAHELRREATQPELSTSELEKFILSCRSFSPDWFFSGGEPFVRSDFPDILALIKKLGMRASVVTNGTLLTEKVLDRLPHGVLRAIFFSFLGPAAEHDAITGQVGSFQQMVDNIQLLTKRHPDCQIYINAPLTEATLRNLDQFFAVLQPLPIKFLRFSQLNFLTPAELKAHEQFAMKHNFLNYHAQSWLPEKVPAIKDLLLEKLQVPWPGSILFDIALQGSELNSWYSEHFATSRICHYIWHTAFIEPDGTVMSCQFLKEPFGNIREQSLLEIWRSQRFQNFRRLIKKQLAPGCARCCKL